MRVNTRSSRSAAHSLANLTTVIAIVFGAYTVVAVAGKYLAEKGEFFPVFSWSLFTDVRNPRWVTAIEIRQVGNETFDPPLSYYDLPHHFPDARRKSINPMKLAKRIRYAVEHDQDDVDELITYMARRFMRIGKPVEWQISRYHVDLIDYHRHGAINEREGVIGPQVTGGQR